MISPQQNIIKVMVKIHFDLQGRNQEIFLEYGSKRVKIQLKLKAAHEKHPKNSKTFSNR